MSREITITGSIAFNSTEGGGGQFLSSDGDVTVSLPDDNAVDAVEQERQIAQDEASLGTAIIRAWIRNLDGLKDLHVLDGPGGDPFLLLRPGVFCNVRFVANVQPVLYAPVGTCVAEIVVVKDLS